MIKPGWRVNRLRQQCFEDVNGRFHILKPSDRKCEELHAHFFHNKDGEGFTETNGTPAVADGRVYFSTRDEIYCIGKKDWNPAKDAGKVPPQPAAKAAGGAAAQLLAYPADVVLAPGGGTQFTLHAFDANGNYYVTDDINGTISKYAPDGTFDGTFASGLTNPLSLVFDNVLAEAKRIAVLIAGMCPSFMTSRAMYWLGSHAGGEVCISF